MFSRNSILNAMIRRSQQFPNCSLKRINDTLEIHLFNSVGEVVRIFEADISGLKNPPNTYYKVYDYLLNNPQVELISEEINKTIKTQIIV